MGLVAFVIVPWTVWLALRLPSHHVTPHWSIAWGGFDVALAASAAFTAYALARNPTWIAVAALEAEGQLPKPSMPAALRRAA